MDTTTCLQTDGWLAAREAGTLDALHAALLAAHLGACESCRALSEAVELDAVPAGPIAAPFPVVPDNIYDVGPVLGYGGMGRIRTAIDRRIGRKVAIKELLFHTDELAARFVREARIAAALQHPNIVPIYDVGCWSDGTPFYTMRLVEGRSLHEAFTAAATARQRMALLPAVIGAADAVAFAHASDVVHRDLTPANILVGEHGETLVIDWGLAKHLRPRRARVASEFQTGWTEQVLTAKGDVIGSPAYMPPEQAAGEPTDARADVYALGAILYHLLSGRAPYAGRSAKAILASVRRDAPVPLERHTPSVPRELADVVRIAMARDPSERYESARQVAAALRAFTAGALADAHRGALGRWFARSA